MPRVRVRVVIETDQKGFRHTVTKNICSLLVCKTLCTCVNHEVICQRSFAVRKVSEEAEAYSEQVPHSPFLDLLLLLIECIGQLTQLQQQLNLNVVLRGRMPFQPQSTQLARHQNHLLHEIAPLKEATCSMKAICGAKRCSTLSTRWSCMPSTRMHRACSKFHPIILCHTTSAVSAL